MALLLLLLVTDFVLQPLYQELLPRIKVNRNFPQIMIYIHITVGGLGLGSMEYEQTVKAINLFISLYQSAISSTQLLKDSLELIQVEVGLDISVLEADYKKFGYLVTYCWI